MSHIIAPNFATANTLTKSLLQRMSRFDLHDRLELIGNEFGRIGFRSGFTLADQVLTHALVSTRSNVEFVVDLDAKKEPGVLDTLKEITRETYGLVFKRRFSSKIEVVLTADDVGEYTAKDKVRPLLAINPLADWSNGQLIEYALAHELPVDPADIRALQPVKNKQAA